MADRDLVESLILALLTFRTSTDLPGRRGYLHHLCKLNTGGGIRTHTGVTPRRILSPLRLPFRHAGVWNKRRFLGIFLQIKLMLSHFGEFSIIRVARLGFLLRIPSKKHSS